MRFRKAVLALMLAAGAEAGQGVSPEEADLLARSLRPEGRAELLGNAAPIAQLPVSEVQAELDPKAARVEGHLRLVVRNREAQPWHEVVLRAYPNSARGTWLRVEDVRLEGKRVAARSHGTVVVVPAELPPGATAAISLTFRGQLWRLRDAEDDPQAAAARALAQMAPGLATLPGKPSPEEGYGTFAVGPRGATLVDWYPQLAARAHGVWDRDEPGPLGDASHADPGSALVALTVPKGWRVAGAGSALGQHPVAYGKETATFAAAGVRGALGLAASPDYEELREETAGVQLRASSMHGEAGARALLVCAEAALTSLQARFGIYPWTALALAEVALTGGAGGVELPGLALVAQALSPREQGSLAPPGMFDFTCYHEVAHQWWQGVVGSDPRRAPWVDEALAQYSAVQVIEDTKGKAAADQASRIFVALNYHGMRMAHFKDGKVARPADEFRTPLAYAGLVYGKAPLFFDRARELMGNDRFDAATRAYRQAWAFREASADGWLSAARRADPEHALELSALQKRWWEEKHGDEDIGPLDGLALMEGLGGGGALSQLVRALQQEGSAGDPQMKDAIKQLERLMPELSRMLEDPDPNQP
jgi:hypothetical protein